MTNFENRNKQEKEQIITMELFIVFNVLELVGPLRQKFRKGNS